MADQLWLVHSYEFIWGDTDWIVLMSKDFFHSASMGRSDDSLKYVAFAMALRFALNHWSNHYFRSLTWLKSTYMIEIRFDQYHYFHNLIRIATLLIINTNQSTSSTGKRMSIVNNWKDPFKKAYCRIHIKEKIKTKH